MPGLKRLKLGARWLRGRLGAGALILGYHRIADAPSDPYQECVTPQRFAEQLEALRRHARPTRLQDLVRGLQRGSLPRRAVAITFDDGYADTLYQAKPLLDRYQIPATVFVTTGYLGRVFWWDELQQLILESPALPETLFLELDGDTFPWTAGGASPRTMSGGASRMRASLLQSLVRRLRPLSAAERERVIAQVRSQVDAEPVNPCRSRVLTPDEVVRLADGGSVEIGAHTVTHPLLADLPADAQQQEIQDSKARLEEILRRPVRSFSYPHGSLSSETPNLVRNSGYDCACASLNDLVRRRSDRFHLPRFWIGDWDGATYARWLRRWLPG